MKPEMTPEYEVFIRMLDFNEPKKVQTAYGPKMLRTAVVPDSFWGFYRDNKEFLKEHGYTLTKKNNQWKMNHWASIDSEEWEKKAKLSIEESRADDANILVPCPEGEEWLPYQKAGVNFAFKRKGTLLADEMGLGKTIQAIGLINMDASISKVVVVCPTSLTVNWARELRRWMVRPLEIGIFTPDQHPWDADIKIFPYSIIDRFKDKLHKMRFDLRIVDEVHYIKNPKAKRSKATMGVQATKKISITGTPIPNKTIEIWPVLNDLDPENWPNYFAFGKRYSAGYKDRFGWHFDGKSNTEELNQRLRSTIMIRRLKSDVLKELPAKTRQVIELPSEDFKDLLRAEDEFDEKDWNEYAESVSTKSREEMAEAFKNNSISKLRQQVAAAKLPMVYEHVRQSLEEEGHKIIIFAHHHNVINAIHEEFKDCSVVLTGQTPSNQRQGIVDAFQRHDKIRLFIGNIQAAGVGLTLTAASHVMFVEFDWVPGNVAQAEDRAHRIGQEDNVLVQFFVLENSIDAYMARTIIEKFKTEDSVLNQQVEFRRAPKNVTKKLTKK